MKFIGRKTGHMGVLLVLSVLAIGCNKDEFFPTEELMAGVDVYCSKAQDEDSCRQLSACQPAFSEAEGGGDPVYEACIANPEIFFPRPGEIEIPDDTVVDDGTDDSADGSTDDSNDEVTDGTTDGSTEVVDSNDGIIDAPAGYICRPNKKGKGKFCMKKERVITESEVNEIIDEAFRSDCKELDPSMLMIKHLVKKGKVIGGVSKVKVCHQTGNGSYHTIVIACPALSSHLYHHEDYIGACQE